MDQGVLEPFWPQDMDPNNILQLHPLSAGVYGVRVLPGTDWPMSGHGNQNSNGWGTARKATDDELEEWAEHMVSTALNAMKTGCACPCTHCHLKGHHRGGWTPARSVVVDWDNGATHYYKAGDDNLYDLCFNPGNRGFSANDFVEQMMRFHRTLTKLMTVLEADKIMRCEIMNSGISATQASGIVMHVLNSGCKEADTCIDCQRSNKIMYSLLNEKSNPELRRVPF